MLPAKPVWSSFVLGFFAFNLNLIINDQSDLLGVRLTLGNVDDRLPVPEITRGLFGDRGYISQPLQDTLKQQGVELITKLMNLMDKISSQEESLD